ncbi:hypothetical protein QOT17_015563 [Balamuthia mandrillaris]
MEDMGLPLDNSDCPSRTKAPRKRSISESTFFVPSSSPPPPAVPTISSSSSISSGGGSESASSSLDHTEPNDWEHAKRVTNWWRHPPPQRQQSKHEEEEGGNSSHESENEISEEEDYEDDDEELDRSSVLGATALALALQVDQAVLENTLKEGYQIYDERGNVRSPFCSILMFGLFFCFKKKTITTKHKQGKVIFSLRELQDGRWFYTENGTRLERISERQVLLSVEGVDKSNQRQRVINIPEEEDFVSTEGILTIDVQNAKPVLLAEKEDEECPSAEAQVEKFTGLKFYDGIPVIAVPKLIKEQETETKDSSTDELDANKESEGNANTSYSKQRNRSGRGPSSRRKGVWGKMKSVFGKSGRRASPSQPLPLEHGTVIFSLQQLPVDPTVSYICASSLPKKKNESNQEEHKHKEVSNSNGRKLVCITRLSSDDFEINGNQYKTAQVKQELPSDCSLLDLAFPHPHNGDDEGQKDPLHSRSLDSSPRHSSTSSLGSYGHGSYCSNRSGDKRPNVSDIFRLSRQVDDLNLQDVHFVEEEEVESVLVPQTQRAMMQQFHERLKTAARRRQEEKQQKLSEMMAKYNNDSSSLPTATSSEEEERRTLDYPGDYYHHSTLGPNEE